MTKKGAKTASGVFRAAIDAAEHLRFQPGTSAVGRGEGKGRIHGGNGALLGSAAMDDDCKAAFGQAARWDYVIGVEVRRRARAFFVEVHSADTSGVSEVEKKLAWLLEFIEREPQHALRTLPREIHWVASGRVNIPKHVPQYKKLTTTLRKKGLLGPVERLDLP